MTNMRYTCTDDSAAAPLLIALTGGPCGGKTTLLRRIETEFCRHFAYVPEIATLLFANGFPWRPNATDRRSAQKAVYVVQTQFETIAARTPGVRAVICDRGTLDGLVYWPGSEAEYWNAIGSSEERELARYDAIIHLRSCPAARIPGDPHRREPPEHAPELDARTLAAWGKHPRRSVIDVTHDFEDKVQAVLLGLRELLSSRDIRQDASP